uniref:DUF5641 domain-containing protein n=1 Tax=Strigamia maritima TaxID=126957 RepID=T1IIB7_STRMM
PKGQIGSHLAYWKTKWYLSSPNQPWWGGFWERLVGLVKRCFFKTIGQTILPWDEIVTLLTKVEATVNSRPIMPVPHDLKDFLDAPVMRPIDFIMPGARCYSADDDDEEEEWIIDGLPKELTPAAKAAIRSMRSRKKVQLRFWKLWNEFYLTDLRRFHLENKSKGRYSAENIHLGMFVLIVDELLPRGRWTMGKVVKIRPSKDGYVRSVSVLTENGTITERPVEHLVPLELEMEEVGMFAFDDEDVPGEHRSNNQENGRRDEVFPRYNLRSRSDETTGPHLSIDVYHPPPYQPPPDSKLDRGPVRYSSPFPSWTSLTLICCLITLILPSTSATDMSQAIRCLNHGVQVNAAHGYGIQVCTVAECRNIPPEDNTGAVTTLSTIGCLPKHGNGLVIGPPDRATLLPDDRNRDRWLDYVCDDYWSGSRYLHDLLQTCIRNRGSPLPVFVSLCVATLSRSHLTCPPHIVDGAHSPVLAPGQGTSRT